MSFSLLGLSAELVRAVEARGYDVPTPIQADSIPLILEGRDVMAGARTGTGKTAAFALPLLQRLSATPTPRGRRPHVRALVLAPTRELAAQIQDSMRSYGGNLPLRGALVHGGVSMQPQTRRLRDGVDVVVATPGRLLDHVDERTVDLSRVEILVLDEADRMLDMGFIRDIRRIMALLPTERQSLMFSATTSGDIQDLARDLMRDPAIVQVDPSNSPGEQIAQVVHPVDRVRKRDLLRKLIVDEDWRQALVFTRTKHGADRLATELNREGIEAEAIHGDRTQAARTRALGEFKRGRVRILVATDVAARGLDIERLPRVVNYELPNVPEDYVHRIGRTGRAGNGGLAISLVCVDEIGFLNDIERLVGSRVPRDFVAGFEPDPNIRAEPVFAKGRGGRGSRGGNAGSFGGRSQGRSYEGARGHRGHAAPHHHGPAHVPPHRSGHPVAAAAGPRTYDYDAPRQDRARPGRERGDRSSARRSDRDWRD